MTDEYDKLKKIFESKECKLLTTREELEKQTKKLSYKKVLFVAKCGHDNSVLITNFKSKSSGVMCKDCMKKQIIQKLKEQNENKQEASRCTIQECQVINQLQSMLETKLHFVKTNEGCKSDMIIKPLDIEEDKWLRIQVKTTLDVSHGLYSFGLHEREYKDHIVLCHCINHNKYWLIPFDVVSHLKSKINIGLTSNSDYHKYETEEHKVYLKLLEYYKTTPLYPYNLCMLPEGINQQKESEYKQKRIQAFPFMSFEQPIYDQCYYDFKVNNIPVQEKKAIKVKTKKNSYVVCLYRRDGKKKYKAYKLGMNKFYWVHIPDTDVFFVFSEDALYQNGYIEDEKTILLNKPMMFISLNYVDGWYQQYRYDYNNIDENIFKEMFNMC